MGNYRVISSDSHVMEPPDVWTDRMDPKYGDRIPHMVEGTPYDQWYADNVATGSIGASGQAGLRFEQPETISIAGSFANVPLGGYDPHVRLKEMDLDGIYGDVIYPSIGLFLYGIPDVTFAQAVFTAYNEWLADFCNTYPDRLKGIAMVLVDDVAGGISELRKAAKIGLSGAAISVYPTPPQFYDRPMYGPFWEAAQSLDMPLSLHVVTNRPAAGQTTLVEYQDAEEASDLVVSGADLTNSDYYVRQSILHMVYSGVFEKYPSLKVVNVEHELGWVPFFIQRADYNYKERLFLTPHRFNNDFLPSDFMRRNVLHSFQEDDLGIRNRDLIGVDNLLWGSDYPHAESTYPKSQEILSRILADVPEDERAKIVGGNAAALYGFR